jgi:hypothetical protein
MIVHASTTTRCHASVAFTSRVACTTLLRTERAHRKLIVRARWLLLKNRESLPPREDATLETG